MCKEVKIKLLKQEIENLKRELQCKEEALQLLLKEDNCKWNTSLSSNEICRYSRQMIMPQISVEGQTNLKNSKVLIVGTGGLGCPSAVYLAAAGVGQITIVDYDDVEISNLHRQILHSEIDIGVPKVESAASKLKRLNSNIKIVPIKSHVSSDTIQSILSENIFDVVIDGTDNVASRYLLNDACVMNKIPLVSGSALQMEGQLTVYNYKGGPCYRCLFPVPPPAYTVTSCGDGGVLGPVPGTIGVLQALEAIKVIVRMPGVLAGRLLLFDGADTTFRIVKLRNRNNCCDVCGDNPSVTSLIDYEQFCGAKAHDKVENINILQNDEMINVTEYANIVKEADLVIDVRPQLEYMMCSLPNTINIPFSNIENNKALDDIKNLILEKHKASKVYFLCRRGNDSQRAVYYLKDKLPQLPVKFVNILGGLHSYSQHVDNSFPLY